MKISDKGLQEILSLGLKKETSIPGVYFLYEWEKVQYIAVPNIDIKQPVEYPEAIKIVLSPSQYNYMENLGQEVERKSALDKEVFKTTTDYFESMILLAYSSNQHEFQAKACYGMNSLLKNFKSGLEKDSPLKIIYETKKAFHGLYHPIAHFDDSLKLVNVKPENLWITAYPLLSAGKLIGATIAFSNKAEVSIDVLEEFKKTEDEYIKVLAL